MSSLHEHASWPGPARKWSREKERSKRGLSYGPIPLLLREGSRLDAAFYLSAWKNEGEPEWTEVSKIKIKLNVCTC